MKISYAKYKRHLDFLNSCDEKIDALNAWLNYWSLKLTVPKEIELDEPIDMELDEYIGSLSGEELEDLIFKIPGAAITVFNI